MLFATPPVDDRERAVIAETERLYEDLRPYLAEPRRWTASLRRTQAARHVQGSNSIEGFYASLDDAAAIGLGEEPIDADRTTMLALTGYRNAMTFVVQLAREGSFAYSLTLLRSLHYMMTSYDLDARPGRWRSGSIFVRSEQTGEQVYEGPPVEDVPLLMASFVQALRDQDPEIPASVRAAMAHLNLVMIHPFRDGNGRMARCLQTLVLARTGLLSPEFNSIEEYLGTHTQAYYDILATTGEGAWNPRNDARPWVRFCLTAHLRQARTVLRRVRDGERLWLDIERFVAGCNVPERALPALWDAAMGFRIRRSVYVAMASETLSEQTATRDLRSLVDAGFLEARGEKRGRFYVASSELRRLRDEIVSRRDRTFESDPFAH